MRAITSEARDSARLRRCSNTSRIDSRRLKLADVPSEFTVVRLKIVGDQGTISGMSTTISVFAVDMRTRTDDYAPFSSYFYKSCGYCAASHYSSARQPVCIIVHLLSVLRHTTGFLNSQLLQLRLHQVDGFHQIRLTVFISADVRLLAGVSVDAGLSHVSMFQFHLKYVVCHVALS
ncbi:unnamed protein product [Closterium sp. Yama58-4]|nr:unnamed protein product [Closterium sp. Yama58-4]